MPDSAVGPDVLAQLSGGRRALEDGGELRSADGRHHPRRAHRARPDPDLDDVGAGGDEVARALGRDDVAGDDRHLGVEGAHRAQGVDHLLLVAVGRVDDEHVSAGVEQVGGLGRDIAVDAHRGGDAKAVVGVDGRRVEVRPQCPGPREDADETAVGTDHRREPPPGVGEGVERRLDVDPVRQGHQVADHDVLELGEPVDTGEVGLRDDPHRALADRDERGAVGALVQQDQRLADGGRRVEGDRGVVDEVARLLPGDDVAHDLGRDVLGDDGQGAAAGGRLRHAAARDGGHVGDHERDRRPRAVDAREVDVEPARHRGAVRHHEDVVVREVVLRQEVVEEAHPTSLGAAPAAGARRQVTACARPNADVDGAGSARESHGPLAGRCRSAVRPAPDAAPRRLPSRACGGRLRRHAAARPGRRLGIRQHGGRGGDGGRTRRLVRGDRPLQAPPRPADPAHGDHPEAEERDRPQPPGVRHRELPHRGDRPRAARHGARGGADRPVARRSRRIGHASAPRSCGSRERVSAGSRTTRSVGSSRTSSCRGSSASRSRRSPARFSRASSRSRRTTGSSTSASSSCTTGSGTTPARMPRCSASARRGGRPPGSTTA